MNIRFLIWRTFINWNPSPEKIAVPGGAGHLDFLDGIRGGAALWVLLAHCAIWGGWHGISVPDPKIAVDIFMVVSGFLMMHLARARAAKEPPGTWAMSGRFWVRRFFRIAPLYYLLLAVSFVLGSQVFAGYNYLQTLDPSRWAGSSYANEQFHGTIANFLIHVSFLFGLTPAYVRTTGMPDWSIALEMQFYAVFPLLFWLFHRLRPLAAALLLWGGALVVRKLIHDFLGRGFFPEPSFLPLKLDMFVVGMLTAIVYDEFSTKPRDAVLALVLALLMASRSTIYVFLLVGLFVLMTRGGQDNQRLAASVRRFFGRLLGNRLTRFMADTSYGVYLVHGFFISLAGAWLFRQDAILQLHPAEKTALLIAVTMIGAYPVAWVLHQLIEKPGIEAGRKFLTSLSGSKAVPL